MAEINVCAMADAGGPHIPARLSARLQKKKIFETAPDVEVDVLYLFLGPDTVRIWPADPERIIEFRDSLTKIIDAKEWK